MRSRSILSVTQLPSFQEWLVQDGWEIVPPKGYYEVLRATKPGKAVCIVHQRLENSGGGDLVHLTVWGMSLALVHQFLRSKKLNRPNEQL